MPDSLEIISSISSIVDSVYEPVEFPALNMLMQEWKCTVPFAGLRVLVGTPIFRNTMLEYKALLLGGADLSVGRAVADEGGSSMPCDSKIVDFLKNAGVGVLTPQEVLALEAEGEYFDLILDCAGQFSKCHPRYGFVELTRSGMHFFENAKIPVFVADSGIVKRIETSLGTGEGYIRGLRQSGFSDFEGKKFAVFGSGKVGSGIVLQLLREGACVQVVTDTSFGVNGFLLANNVSVLDCKNVSAVSALVLESDFVVTATGVKNALDVPEITDALLKSKAILANMGVEDEYGAGVPAERVLSAKAPLNFILEEPTHLKYIDASLALHAALGERLMQEVMGIVDADNDFIDCKNSEKVASCESLAIKKSTLRNPPVDLEQRILIVSIQNGVIGPEINEMLGYAPEE